MEQSKFYQIKNVTEHEYTLVGCDGSVITRPIRDIDKSASVFTIQDAKDGDVLVYEGEIFMIKFYVLWHKIVYHCCYDGERFITDSLYSLTEQDKMDIHPATKEQRDKLEKAITDAGYMWDTDKKELKKIEQKPAWSEEDDINLRKAIWYVENPAPMVVKDSMLVEWLKSLRPQTT